MRRFASFLVIVSLATVTSVYAQTKVVNFEADLLVPKEKSAEQYDVVIGFGENEVTFVAKKPGIIKTFQYSDIKTAEYSYAKKPRFGAGLALAMLVSVFLIPIMFTKSKQHWLAVKTEKDYVVLKLRKNNFRMVLPAFETHGVKVVDMGNEEDKKKSDGDK